MKESKQLTKDEIISSAISALIGSPNVKIITSVFLSEFKYENNYNGNTSGEITCRFSNLSDIELDNLSSSFRSYSDPTTGVFGGPRKKMFLVEVDE